MKLWRRPAVKRVGHLEQHTDADGQTCIVLVRLDGHTGCLSGPPGPDGCEVCSRPVVRTHIDRSDHPATGPERDAASH